MRNIKEIIVDDKKIYLKKGFFGKYRIVYPYKNPDGSFNWFNFITGGSYENLIYALIVSAIILGLIFSYVHDLNFCKELIECGAQCPEPSVFNPFLN